MNIVRSGEMHASDIRYQNDSAEVLHALNLVQRAREMRIDAVEKTAQAGGNISSMLDSSLPLMLLPYLDEQIWFSACFVGCFTKEDNQLSQWRGYCPPHKGISFGFHAEDLRASAEEQGYTLRECVYESNHQQLVADQLLNALRDLPEPHNADRLTDTFETFQQIAAVLKHPRFAEEKECRLISQAWERGRTGMDVQYREGKSMVMLANAQMRPRPNV